MSDAVGGSDFIASRVLREIYEPVVRKMLEDDLTIVGLMDPRSPEERKAHRERYEAKQAARLATHERNIGNVSALGWAILELHSPSPRMDECEGCDGGPDYSGDWPCRTYRLVCEIENLETP